MIAAPRLGLGEGAVARHGGRDRAGQPEATDYNYDETPLACVEGQADDAAAAARKE